MEELMDSEFCQMWRVDRNKGGEVTNSALISDLFEPDSAFREDYEISEEEREKNLVRSYP